MAHKEMYKFEIYTFVCQINHKVQTSNEQQSLKVLYCSFGSRFW